MNSKTSACLGSFQHLILLNNVIQSIRTVLDINNYFCMLGSMDVSN